MKTSIRSMPYAATQTAERPGGEGKYYFFIAAVVLIWVASIAVGFEYGVLALTALGFGAALIGLRFPVIGVMGIGILSVLDAVARNMLMVSGILPYNTFNYFLLLVMALSVFFLLRLNMLPIRAFQAFVFLMLIGLIYTPDMSEGMADTFNVVTMLGLVIFFARALKQERVYYWLAVTAGLMGALGGLVFFLQLSRLPYLNPNSWAYFPVTALFAICLAFATHKIKGREKSLLFLLAGVCMVWIFFSGSRSNMLAGGLCLLYMLLAQGSITRSVIIVAVVGGLALLFAYQFADVQEYALSRIQKTFDPRQSLSARTSKRSDIILQGFEIFKRNPAGIGTGGFQTVYAETLPILGTQGRPSHNAWVKSLVENGVPGLLVLAAFVASFAFIGLRRKEKRLMYLGFLISMQFAMLFMFKEYQGKGLWFLAAGGLALLYEKEMIDIVERSRGFFARRLPRVNRDLYGRR